MIRGNAQECGWPAKLLHWLGAAVIVLLLVHGWWMTHITPRPERLANYGWHAALGWAMAGTGRTPLKQDLLGIDIPLLTPDRSLRPLLEDTHKYLAYVLAALVLVHIAGGLRHHFVKKNTVLRRMTVGLTR